MSKRNPGWGLAILTALVLAGLYIVLAGQATLWDRDEPRFAQATWEMLQSGTLKGWLVPTFEGRLRADKPILIYWVMAGPVALFGPTEMALRLGSCLAMAGTCLLTYFIGRRLFSPTTGWWAMAMLGTSLMVLAMGTLCTADAVLLLFMTASLAVFVAGWTGGRWTVRHTVPLGLTLGGAWLTKGPVALLPVATMLAVILWPTKRLTNPVRGLADADAVEGTLAGIGIANGIALLMFLAWALPANYLTDNEYLRIGLGRHVAGRLVAPMEGHGGGSVWLYLVSLPIYIPVAIAFFFPWTLHLPGGLHMLWHGRLGGILPARSLRLLMLAWIAPTLVVMTLSATKLPHYIMPIWPALAVIAAATLEAQRRGGLSEWDQRWLRGGVWFFAPVGAGLGLALLLSPWILPGVHANFQPLASMRWPGTIGGALLLMWTALAVVGQLRERVWTTARLGVAGGIIVPVVVWVGVLPTVERYTKLSPQVARIIQEKTPAVETVTFCGYDEGSLLFYLRRGVPAKIGAAGLGKWMAENQPGVLVVRADLWATAVANTKAEDAARMEVVGRVRGINFNDAAKPVELWVVHRAAR